MSVHISFVIIARMARTILCLDPEPAHGKVPCSRQAMWLPYRRIVVESSAVEHDS